MVHIPCDYSPTIQALSTWSYLATTNNNVYRQNSPTKVKSDDQTESANTQGGILAFPVCSSFLPGYFCTKTRHSGWIIQQTNLSSVSFRHVLYSPELLVPQIPHRSVVDKFVLHPQASHVHRVGASSWSPPSLPTSMVGG